MLVPREDIDLGTAVWNESLCLRHSGDSCTMCVDHCPVGTLALEILENRVVVHEDHCTGCGSCQNNCPTHPKSIVVTPKAGGCDAAECLTAGMFHCTFISREGITQVSLARRVKATARPGSHCVARIFSPGAASAID